MTMLSTHTCSITLPVQYIHSARTYFVSTSCLSNCFIVKWFGKPPLHCVCVTWFFDVHHFAFKSMQNWSPFVLLYNRFLTFLPNKSHVGCHQQLLVFLAFHVSYKCGNIFFLLRPHLPVLNTDTDIKFFLCIIRIFSVLDADSLSRNSQTCRVFPCGWLPMLLYLQWTLLLLLLLCVCWPVLGVAVFFAAAV